MCGRFVSATPPDELASYFGAEVVEDTTPGPSFNVAPTNDVFVVLDSGGTRRLDTFHWGLVPPWAKDPSISSRMINARSETVTEKPVYRTPFAKRRCIIPADGFYEWKPLGDTGGFQKGRGKKKQPYFIHNPDGEPYAFGGLWEVWKGPKERDPERPSPYTPENPLRSCTILTGAPNEPMSQLHDRMPIILPRSAWDEWLSPEVTDTELLGKFLVPSAPEIISFHPVSTAVNSVRNKGPELLDPVPALDEPEATAQLFDASE